MKTRATIVALALSAGVLAAGNSAFAAVSIAYALSETGIGTPSSCDSASTSIMSFRISPSLNAACWNERRPIIPQRNFITGEL